MKITFNNKHRELGDEAIENVEGRILATFSKFESEIVSVELSAEDVNGPRGGVDKQCRILVRLRKMDDVVASVHEASVSKAVARAIRRAERSIKRRIQRRGRRDVGRRSAFGFSVQ